MYQTAYRPLLTIGRTTGGFIGGFCRWWYTPIENIQNFPAVNPVTQAAIGEPILKAGKTWYGPVGVPDNQLGWEEDSQSAKAGIFYKEKVSGIITGLDADTHINLQNMAYHQYCIVGKARSGGNYYILGNQETGLDLQISMSTGLGADNTPATKFVLTGEAVDRALILTSFAGTNSVLPVGSSQPVFTSGGSNVDILTYIASGTEGATVTFSALAVRSILLFSRESTLLDLVDATPATPRQVQRNLAGDQYTFYSDLEADEIIKVLYKV